MKVSICTLNMHPEGWALEKEVASDMTVGRFKLLLLEEAGAPKLTASTRVLHKTATAMMSLRDEDKVKKRMVLTDPANPADAPQAQPPLQPVTIPLPKAAAAKEPSTPTKAPMPTSAKNILNIQAAAESKALARAMQSSATPAKSTAAQPAAKAVPRGGPAFLALPVEELDSSMRGRLVEFTGWRWQVSKVSEMSAGPSLKGGKSFSMAVWSQKQVMDFLVDLNGRLRETVGRSTFTPCGTLIHQVFGNTADMLENSEHGVPMCYDSVLRAANEMFELYRPLLAKWGLPETAAAIVATQKAAESHINVKEVFDLVVRASFSMTFAKDKTRASQAINHTIWTTWLMGLTNPIVITKAYVHHLALKPLECKRCSYARTIAYCEAMVQQTRHEAMVAAAKGVPKEKRRKAPERVVWIFGATGYCERELARMGYFEDAGAFKGKGSDAMSIYLIGSGIEENDSDEVWPCGEKVKVWAATYDDVAESQIPDPSMIFFFNSGLGTLESAQYEEVIPHLIDSLKHRCQPVPFVFLTSRSESEVKGETALLDVLGVAGVWTSPSEKNRRRHLRNLFSGMAGNPDIECDDNGYITAFCLLNFEERASELLEYQKNPELLLQKVSAKLAADGEPVAPGTEGDGDAVAEKVSKSPVTFWGILDLKYDPHLPPEQRVKVLETGDGRASKFSGYGAAIKDAVQSDMKMQDTIRRAVMVENKKLFHDIILENGYAHVRPDQEAFPKAYDAGLAERIKLRFNLYQDDICVLKLVNRARGAGVIPVAVSELDEKLKILLQPPEDLQAWLKQQPSNWAQTVEWGCFEEQVRHWWSNECPCFLVEQFCQSVSTEKMGMQFDGTMRVGFALMREDKDRLPPGWIDFDGGPIYVGDQEGDSSDDPKKKPVLHPWGDSRPWLGLFRPNRSMVLRISWLGGYWKLPVEPADSSDLRGRIVSVAKRGTAPVAQHHLHDVYSMLGDMVPVTFNTQDMSHNSLLKRYSSFPELGAFITTRLACSMRMRDKQKSLDVMRLAQTHISKLVGQSKQVADSYIHRNLAVFDAGHGNWTTALHGWQRSLELMPCNATTRYLIGLYHLEHKNHQACIRFIEESILLDPDFKAPYACLAVAHLQSGNYFKAVEVSESGLKRHPGVAPSSYNLGAASFAAAATLSRKGPSAHAEEIRKLRAKALENLVYARDNRSKEQAWTEEDDQMIEILSDDRKSLVYNDSLPCDGWRIVNWRP
mmetsp:Transcript_148690/g.277103  ORF Transcript_148690/g.277103 Transcript_148690/m.277103 type:complete len:1223 (-) Transcript_148690:71-3739(-)